MSFTRYPEYKDSSIEWLGEVPNGWGIVPIKWFSSCSSGDGISVDKIESESSDQNQIPIIGGNGIMGFTSHQNVFHHVLAVGRVGALCGNIHSVYPPAWITDNALILDVDLNFFNAFYLANVLRIRNLNDIASKTAQPLITGTLVSEQRIPCPSIDEQNAIATFLDCETAKIDALVTEQKRLIELLKEKRQAVIFHAVTQGLNPNVKMKDSGIEWLGMIPEGWEVKRLKFLFEIKKRISGDEGFDVLSITQKGIKIKDIESGDGQLSMDYSKYQFVEVGDFAMNHMDLLTGYVDISKFFGVTSPDYRVFSIKNIEKSFSKYYLYLLQMGYNNKIFFAYGQGSSQLGRWRFPTEQFNDFVFPQPSIEEQIKISSFLDKELDKMDTLTSEAKRAIDLLLERRTALISAAVTGKIDVRGMA